MKLLPIDLLEIDNEIENKTLALFRGDALTYVLHRDGVYEKHFLDLVKLIVKKNDYVLDLGANLGYHTITLSKLIGNDGLVYAIEPQRLTFQQLNCNIILNKLDNVHTLNAAVGDKNSTIFIEHVDYYKEVDGYFGTNIGNASVNFQGTGDEIQLITVDSLNLPKLNFIKIDIQGCELNAIIGAKHTIQAHRPIMFVEIEPQHLINFNATPELLMSHIKDLNYTMYQINNEYPCDHICIPTERLTEILSILSEYKHKLLLA